MKYTLESFTCSHDYAEAPPTITVELTPFGIEQIRLAQAHIEDNRAVASIMLAVSYWDADLGCSLYLADVDVPECELKLRGDSLRVINGSVYFVIYNDWTGDEYEAYIGPTKDLQ